MFAFVGALLDFRGCKMWAVKSIEACTDAVENVASKTANSFLKVSLTWLAVTFVVSALLVLSVLMYAAFYSTYVPYIVHEKPVHFTFDTDNLGRRSEMTAVVSLHNKVIQPGQPYDIYLQLEMPESPKNKDLGMFMVCCELHWINKQVTDLCRATMLRYKSPLLEFLHTVAYSPFHLSGATEEKQTVDVHLFDDYKEEFRNSGTVILRVKSSDVEIYSGRIVVRADIYGLKYYMFHYPIISAAIGIFFNLFVIVGTCIATWYQLMNSDEYREYKEAKAATNVQCESDPGSSGSSSIENITGMEDYEARPQLRRRIE